MAEKFECSYLFSGRTGHICFNSLLGKKHHYFHLYNETYEDTLKNDELADDNALDHKIKFADPEMFSELETWLRGAGHI